MPTVEPLPTGSSPAEIFDVCINHILDLPRRAANASCSYHTKDGLMCPIGRLFGSELAKKIQAFTEQQGLPSSLQSLMTGTVEGGHYATIREWIGEDRVNWLTNELRMLAAIQAVHDKSDNWHHLIGFAKIHKIYDIATIHDIGIAIRTLERLEQRRIQAHMTKRQATQA